MRTAQRPTSRTTALLAICAATLVAAFGALDPAAARAETPWENGGTYAPLGDPDALRTSDRPLPIVWRAFPTTLRRTGPNSRLVTIATVNSLIYESMIQIHPDTEGFIPCLANEWKIEQDGEGKQTFWFRLDPRARFSDGAPVTAKDIYYSWWHRVQEDRNDPSNRMTFFENYSEPQIIDERTIKVSTKEANWRLFLYFGGMAIYPAKYVNIPGEQYLEEYNWKFMPGTGPYVLKDEDLKKGDSLTLTRRQDWWAENEPWGKNTYNFSRITFSVIRDQELEYEKFKAGELAFYRATRAQRWVQDLPREEVIQMGWVQRRKVHNEAPQGISGFIMNMREPPFNDRRVRLAFAHLFNRERLMAKLFFNQYTFIDSYYPGRDWGSGDTNPKIRFDPDKAEELLWEAGYKERNEAGYLVGQDGKEFEVTLEYGAQSWERIWLIVKEDYEQAGIRFNLKLIDPSTLIKRIGERQFNVVFYSFTGLLFPNPETSWRSDLADVDQNNNIPGFKNERVDELLDLYDLTLDRAEQKKIIREIDSIIFKEHPYALAWYSNYIRVLYWDRFGFPDTYFSRIGDQLEDEVLRTWWFHPAKQAALEEAMKSGKAIPPGETDVFPWGKN